VKEFDQSWLFPGEADQRVSLPPRAVRPAEYCRAAIEPVIGHLKDQTD
jgi:hypothetical protein